VEELLRAAKRFRGRRILLAWSSVGVARSSHRRTGWARHPPTLGFGLASRNPSTATAFFFALIAQRTILAQDDRLTNAICPSHIKAARNYRAAGQPRRLPLQVANGCCYVPSFQPARYSSCSGVSLSILMLIDSSFSFATRLSRSSGTR
jgi:hypothetical protein